MPLPVWSGFASFLWHDGERQAAIRCLRAFVERHGSTDGLVMSSPTLAALPSRTRVPPSPTDRFSSASLPSPAGSSPLAHLSSSFSAAAISDVATAASAAAAASGGAALVSFERALAAKAWLKLGEWQRHVAQEHTSTGRRASGGYSGRDAWGVDVAVHHYGAAVKLNPASYKAWHALALTHFEVVQAAEELAAGTDSVQSPRAAGRRHSQGSHGRRASYAQSGADVRAHVVPAIECFFTSIALGTAHQRSLQDILRLLTLWFQHGGSDGNTDGSSAASGGAGGDGKAAERFDVDPAIMRGLQRTPVDVWLGVIPQLIARIHHPVRSIRTAVCDLLVRIGLVHPQGLCFPLTVASHSRIELQHEGATHVLDEMRRECDALVTQAHLV